MPRPSINRPRRNGATGGHAAPQLKPIGREEFRRRRRALMKLMGRDSIAIVPTAPVRLRNNDVEYAYRPDSDFYYLSGFAEPEAVAVLVPNRPQVGLGRRFDLADQVEGHSITIGFDDTL